MQELCKVMGLEGRLQLEWISSAEAQKFVEVVTAFTEKIRKLGPSPLTTVDLYNFGNSEIVSGISPDKIVKSRAMAK